MADKTDPFVVPQGLLLEQDERGLTIEHEGDIVLHGSLGQRLHRVISRHGNVVLHMDADVEELAAPRGDVTVHGTLRAGTVRGRTVHVQGGVRADGVYGGGVQIDGDLDAGVVSAQEQGVEIAGTAVVRGEIESDGGSIRIQGDAAAGSLLAEDGRIEVAGTTQATEVRAGAEVVLKGGVVARNITSDGEVGLSGTTVDVERVICESLRLYAIRSVVRSAQARAVIEVGPGSIESDVFISPVVELSPETSGRITGIDSRNDPGASRVRGCLRLEELSWYLGDIETFLSERGLKRLFRGDDALAGRPSLHTGPPVSEEPPAEPEPATTEPATTEAHAPASVLAEETLAEFTLPEEDSGPAWGADLVLGPAGQTEEAPIEFALLADAAEEEAGEAGPETGVSGEQAIEAASDESDGDAIETAPAEDDGVIETASADDGDGPIETAPPGDESVIETAPAEDDGVIETASADDGDGALETASADDDDGALETASADDSDGAIETAPAEDDSVIETAPAEDDGVIETVPGEPEQADEDPIEAAEAEEEEDSVIEVAPAVEDDEALETAPADETAAAGSADEASEDDGPETAVASFATEAAPAETAPETAPETSFAIVADAAEEEGDGDDVGEDTVQDAAGVSSSAADLGAEAAEAPETDGVDLASSSPASAETAPLGPGDLALLPVERPAVEETSEDLFDLDTNALGPEPADEEQTEADDGGDGEPLVVEEVEVTPPSGKVLSQPSGLMLREDAVGDSEPVAVVAVELDENLPTTVHEVPAIAVAEAEPEAADEPAPAEAAPEPEEAAPVAAASTAPEPAPAPIPPSDPIYMLMLETVGRMSTCYDDQDMPPPVATLRSMVESQDYDGIRTGFSTLWSELVSYHRDRGMQLQPRVSHTFRTIDTIVRNL